MKSLVILVALVAIVLFVSCLLKYLNGGLGFTVDDNKLTIRVADLPYLNAGEYMFNIKNAGMLSFLVLLIFFRSLILKLALRQN